MFDKSVAAPTPPSQAREKRPGRPRLSGLPMGSICFRVPVELHDRACLEALRNSMDLSALIRRALQRELDGRS
jgi:predicted HicB family RNase H-like nuclease